MEHIERFFECLLPTTQCNLACEYCYIIQENRRGMENIVLDYPVAHILKALSKQRVGGICFFSLCGTGETFLQKELLPLTMGLLENGHYVNITTNGTVTKRIEELAERAINYSGRLNFSFSLHYVELKKKNMLDCFFKNIKTIRKYGYSFVVQMNLYDGYLQYLEEIKEICLKEVGALPQLAATRLEKDGDVKGNIFLHTKLSTEEYSKVGKEFQSPLFDFTMQNFNVKRREFCYAGDWSFNLNLKNGNLKACYHSGKAQNIFEDISKPIIFSAVGHNCNSRYCVNSSHFLSLGVIPSLDTPTYAQLRNRKEANWYHPDFEKTLNLQFKEYKKEYGLFQKIKIDSIETLRRIKRKLF